MVVNLSAADSELSQGPVCDGNHVAFIHLILERC